MSQQQQSNPSGTLLWTISLLVVTTVTVNTIRSKRKEASRRAELEQWIDRARRERDAKQQHCLMVDVPPDDDENDDDDDDYMATTRLSASEIRTLVANGKLDPSEHVVRLAKRCRRYGRGSKDGGVNAVTEELFDEAYEAAKEIRLGETTTVPLLLGVPVSVKDSIGLEGAYSTGGLACRLRKRDAKDSLIVQVLKSSGALPLCRGNVPQVMMIPESTNYIWGRTLNPWDLSRTPGGSSGGDGALVAMGCVPLAVTSDVAGSIRIPAAFCGLTGFKPTSTRLSYKGIMIPRKDDKNGVSVAIPPVVGPIARSVDDCALFMKAACVPELYDTDLNLAPLPFNEAAYESKGKLRIGYYYTDGWFEPCSAAKRGLKETIDALTKAGHECVPFDKPRDGWFTYGLLVSINGAEGNFRSFKEAVEGETLIPEYNTLVTVSDLPNWVRWLVQKLSLVDQRSSHLLSCTRSGGIAVWDLWQLLANLLKLRSVWSDAFCEAGIDAVLHPALPLPALPHGISGDITSAFSYTFLANMLLWPAGVVPVTVVRPEEQHYSKADLPTNQQDKMADLAAKVMTNSAGLPISVAVMTPAFRDEQCLRVMKEVERVVGFKAEPTAYKEDN